MSNKGPQTPELRGAGRGERRANHSARSSGTLSTSQAAGSVRSPRARRAALCRGLLGASLTVFGCGEGPAGTGTASSTGMTTGASSSSGPTSAATGPTSAATDGAATEGSASGPTGGPTSGPTSGDPTGESTMTGVTTEGTSTGTSTGTTGATSEGTSEGTTAGGLLEECPAVANGALAATVDDPEIDEASGMVASRGQPGVLWVHNDSGDSARVFAIDTAGKTLGVFNLAGVEATDWEDLSLGAGPKPGPGTDPWLYIGDIGDNAEKRPSISVVRIPEPDAAAAEGGEVTVDDAELLTLTYPDGAHNAETLLVDPDDGELVIVTKGDTTGVYHLPGPIAKAGSYELIKVPEAAIPLTVTTGGDISPLGDFVIVRTYIEARLWLRPPGTGLAQAFAGEPCVVPLNLELQGETLAIAGDGEGYYTLSENVSQPLWWFAWE